MTMFFKVRLQNVIYGNLGVSLKRKDDDVICDKSSKQKLRQQMNIFSVEKCVSFSVNQ